MSGKLKFGVRTSEAGDINASSKKDLMRLQASVLAAGNNAKAEEKKELVNELAVAIKAGSGSKESVKFGAAFAGMLSEQIDREGFMRTILVEQPTIEGAPITLSINQKRAIAVIATGPGFIRSQIIEGKIINPPEWENTFSATMMKVQMHRTPGDHLNKLYNDGLEAMMVQEDRMLKKMADKILADGQNEVDITATELTPKDISTGVTYISDHGGVPSAMLLSYGLLNDILTGTAFSDFFNPIANMEIVKTGRLGELFGVLLMTDGARTGNLRVLNPGEGYIFSRGDLLGAYTDRNGIESAEVNGISNPSGGFSSVRGWNLESIMSMTVFNDKGVYKLIKV